MKKIILIALCTLGLMPSCDDGEWDVTPSIYLACYEYGRLTSAAFYLFPQGDYVSFYVNDDKEYDNSGCVVNRNGEHIESVRKLFYSSYHNTTYRDYMGQFKRGKYFIVCDPLEWYHFVGKNVEIPTDKIFVFAPEVAENQGRESGKLYILKD